MGSIDPYAGIGGSYQFTDAGRVPVQQPDNAYDDPLALLGAAVSETVTAETVTETESPETAAEVVTEAASPETAAEAVTETASQEASTETASPETVAEVVTDPVARQPRDWL